MRWGEWKELEKARRRIYLTRTDPAQRCPHSSFPLSRATPFDIEDFGIRLSAGLRCPKHDWSFDLVRGNSDRGSYRLGIWEVQLRRIDGTGAGSGVESKMVGEGYGEGEEEVWVRRKQRMG